jgi:serine/threonine protein kinase/formylglycine-generating enzyme required for sulfatase activity
MPDFIGQSFGRYHILEQLGEGGMATVFKAYDTRLEREAAVKIIRRDVFPPNQLENILKRFEREAKALARLAHPNIVSVIDYGEQDSTPYLVMVYLPGGTLKQRLGKPIPWQEAVRLLIPIARALQFAHSQNIVHRDVKPSNILITLSGEPMLTDFGIAKILDIGEGHTLTGTGVGVGTPEYMAPEQWTGQSGSLSDIYSLGVVLYEMLTGRKPYVADTPAAVLLKQTNDPLPRPSQYVPGLPEAVEKLLYKALAKKPEDRYPDMGAVVNALENLLAAAVPDTRPVPAEKPIPQPASWIAEEPPTAIAQETPPRVERDNIPHQPSARKLKLLPFGIGAAVLLVLIGGIFGINSLIKNRPLAITPGETATETLSRVPTESFVPFSPASTFPITDTPLPTATFDPTLGIGSTWVPIETVVLFTQTLTFTVIDTTTATFDPALGIGLTWTRPADGMVMVYVPEGEFTMGSNINDDERPIHQVYLDAFWMDQTEVTNKMYEFCVTARKCDPPHSRASYTRSNYYGYSEYDDFPVTYVSWNDATAYCVWAGGGEYEVRLPTEAEWEKAARGTDGRTYPWGEGIDCQKANYQDGSKFCVGDTSRVGSYESGKSPYGVYDMAGNVWEWVADWYSSSYYSTLQNGIHNPSGPTFGTYRVLRGGSLGGNRYLVRSAIRLGNDPSNNNYVLGFRCSRTP